jgi:hypothetical protein
MTEEPQDIENGIDELAVQIERSIENAKEVNEKFDGVFDPKHRRMEEANVSPAQLFS